MPNKDVSNITCIAVLLCIVMVLAGTVIACVDRGGGTGIPGYYATATYGAQQFGVMTSSWTQTAEAERRPNYDLIATREASENQQ